MIIYFSNRLSSYYSIAAYLFFATLGTNISFAQTVENKKEIINTNKEVTFGAGVDKVSISMWGGGAGGNAGGETVSGNTDYRRSGSGGGASSWAGKILSITPGKKYSVKVGKGGSKGVFNESNNTGSWPGDGDNSSFADGNIKLVESQGGFASPDKIVGGGNGRAILPAYNCSNIVWPTFQGITINALADIYTTITWDGVPGASSYYIIYQPRYSNLDKKKVIQVSENKAILTDLKSGVLYDVQIIVRPKDGLRNLNVGKISFTTLSSISNRLTVPPSTVLFYELKANSVKIDASKLNAYFATVEYKKRSEVQWSIINGLTITNQHTFLKLENLEGDTEYDFRVKSGGEPNAIYYTTKFKTNITNNPSKISNYSLYGQTSTNTLLSWNQVNGNNGYIITYYRGLFQTELHTPKDRNWINLTNLLPPGHLNQYQIRENSNSESDVISVDFKTADYCYAEATFGEPSFQLNGGNGGLANEGKYGFSGSHLSYGSKGYGTVDLPSDGFSYGAGESPLELYVKVYGGAPTPDGVNPGDGGGGGGIEIVDYNALILLAISNTIELAFELGGGGSTMTFKELVKDLLEDQVIGLLLTAFDIYISPGIDIANVTFRDGTDGGTGADGIVELFYTCPVYKFTSPPVTSRICGNSGSSTITVFSRNMPDGKYVITYNSSIPSFVGKTAEMAFENGRGYFSTAAIQDNSLITITNISSGTGATCSNAIDDYNTVRTIVKNSSITEINTSVVENICLGQTIKVPFFIGCKTFNEGNQFSLELSQSNGSFATSVILGTIPGTRSGEIEAEIPNYVSAGSRYRVRVNGSSPYTLGDNNGRDIAISPAAGSISASTSSASDICGGSSVILSSISTSLNRDTTIIEIFKESFNSAVSGWTLKNESKGGAVTNAAWNVKPDNFQHSPGDGDGSLGAIHFPDSSPFFYVSSTLQSNQTTGTSGFTRSTLESPSFSTMGMSRAKLSLNTAYLYSGNRTETFSEVRIEVSKNGTDWVKVYQRRNEFNGSWSGSSSILGTSWTWNSFYPKTLEVELDEFVNETQLKVRFVYESEFTHSSRSFWAIDDVKIIGEQIPDRLIWSSSPAGFTSNDINPNTFVPNESASYSVVRMNNYGCSSSSEPIHIDVKANSSSYSELKICSSELPYTWNGLVFEEIGIQTVKLVNMDGCDSLATLNLEINDSFSFKNISICSSELPYIWNGLTFSKTETQTAHLVNSFGCDSSAILRLKVLDTGSTTNKSICNADFPFVWNGITISEPGTQMATFTNSVGCDSIATLNLSLSSEDVIVETNYTTACEGTLISLSPILKIDSAKLLQEKFNDLSNNWKRKNLNVLDSDQKGAWIIYPDNYLYKNVRTYQSNDRSQFYLSSAYDAATEVETNVSLESPEFSTQGYTSSEIRFFHTFDGGPYDSIKVEISRNLGITWQTLYKYSNQTGSTIGNIGQSDRFIEKVIPLIGYLNDYGLKIRFVHKAVGYGGRWAIDNVKITGAVDVVYNWSSIPAGFNSSVKAPSFTMGSDNSEVFLTVTNIDGCQSTDSQQIISKEGEITTSNTTQTICSSQLPFKWNGLTFVAEGTQTAILKNSVGCDSLATLVLDVQASSTSVTDMVACNEYLWNGNIYTEKGTYTFETLNAIGCDSIATLNLVLNSNSSETNLSICSSELSTFIWNGLSFTESSTKSVILTNALGCDSTAVINLSVSPLAEVNTSDTILCAGDLINLTANLEDGASLVILEEAFNAPLTDWTITNNSTSNAGWKFYDAVGYQGRVSSDHSQFIGVNTIIESGSNLTSTILTSPSIDASAYKTLRLNFEQDFLYMGATIKIEASDNYGESWSTVYSRNSLLIFSETEVNLDTYAGKPNVKIRFKFHETGFKGWWFIDNVKFTGLLKQKFTWTSNPVNFMSTEQ
ncbi:MAG: hypothetical protein ACI8Q1_002622, partial [Parvicella sp.]